MVRGLRKPSTCPLKLLWYRFKSSSVGAFPLPPRGTGFDYSTKSLFTRYPQMGKIGAESDDDEQTTISRQSSARCL